MSEQNIRQRVNWTTRIAIRPSDKDAIRTMAKEEMVSIANLIGTAVTEYLTARSS